MLFIILATCFILLLPLGLSHQIFSINFILSCFSPSSPHSSYYSCHTVYPNKFVPSILICHAFHHPRHMLHTTPATRFIPSHLFYQFYFVLFFTILPTFFILLLPLDISQHIFSVNFILSCFSPSSPHSSYYSCHTVYPNKFVPSILICHAFHHPRHMLHTTPATRFIPSHLFYQFYFVLFFTILPTFFILLLPLGISQHIFSIIFILSCYSSTSPHSSYYSCHQVYPIKFFLSILFCLVIRHPPHILQTTSATRYIPTHLFYQFYFVLLFTILPTFFKLLLPLDISQHIFSINFIFLVIHQPRHIIHTSPATRFIPSHLFYQFYFVLLFINLATFCILLLPLDISQHIFSVNFILSCFSPSSPHSSYLSCHQVYPITSFLSILFCLVIHHPPHILHTTPATRFIPSHLFYQFFLSCYSPSSPHSSNYSCHQIYPNTSFLSILFCLVIHQPRHILHTSPATRFIPSHLFYQFNFVLLFINLATFCILLLPLGISQHIFSIIFILSCYSSTSPHSSYYSCHQVYPIKFFLSILFCLVFHHPPHILHTTPATRFIPSHLFYQFYFVLFFTILPTFFILLLPLGISQHIFSIIFILSCYSSTSPHSSYYSCHQVYPIKFFLSILFCLVIRHPPHILQTTSATRYIPHIFSINFILSCYSPSSPHSSNYSCHQIYPNTSFLSILFCLVIHQPRHIIHTSPATRFIPSHLFYQFYFVLLFINLATFCILLLPLDISQHIFSVNFILSCFSPSSPHSSYYSCHTVYPNKFVPSILICHAFHHPRHMLHTIPATTPTNLFHLF